MQAVRALQMGNNVAHLVDPSDAWETLIVNMDGDLLEVMILKTDMSNIKSFIYPNGYQCLRESSENWQPGPPNKVDDCMATHPNAKIGQSNPGQN